MRRIKKEKPKPHVLIPDTSAIWHEDKQYCVDPDFDNFWTSYANQFVFELCIPEVVKGELLFQHSTSAIKSLHKAKQAISDVERVTHRQYSHRVTEQRIKHEIEQKYRQWEEKHNAKILTTPINVILWQDVIHKALWREAPFVFDSQNVDNEKGFRDCVILETIKHYCSKEQRDISIAFLCKDKLLRETTEKALLKDKRFSVYELITDFKTYLDLTKEKLEDAFIKALVKRASDKFYSRGDADCLYFRDNLKGILQEKYRKYFDNPEESKEKSMISLISTGLKKWEPTDSGSFWISRSQFQKTDSDGQYVWLNTVTYVRQYTSTESLGLLGSLEGPCILILPFFITWRARVTSDGRFRGYSFLNDELKGNQFKVTTDEDKKRWGLEETKS